MRLRSLSTLAIASCLMLTVTSGQSAIAAVPWAGFDDVPPSSTFYSDVSWLYDAGITKGCNPPSNTLFCPKEPVTRGQMAAFLTRALDLPAVVGGDWFEDDDGSVFENDIDRLAAAGITKGCNPPVNTRFCPNDPVTRAQMATFLARALELSSGSTVDWFTDDDQSVHSANINRLRTAWITFGCNPPTEDHFCPGADVTREEMAAFLHRGMTQPVQGAAIDVHGSTWPDPIYLYGDMVATFGVRNTGTVPFVDVVGGPQDSEYDPDGGCLAGSFSGPVERLGNSDSVLDPGEIWDWYCRQYAYDWAGFMYFEATGTTGASEWVSALEDLQYSAIDPIYATVAASATSVEPGEEVTWTIVLHNPSPVNCTKVLVEARENGWGSFTDFYSPKRIVVGDGDAVLEPGEAWEYEYSATLWSDTYLDVGGSYAPDFAPMTGTGFASLISSTVTVES